MGGVEVRGLGRVDDRASADRDEAVDVRLVRELRRGQKGSIGRLDLHLVVESDVDAGRPERASARPNGSSAPTLGSVRTATRESPSAFAHEPTSSSAPRPNVIGFRSTEKADSRPSSGTS